MYNKLYFCFVMFFFLGAALTPKQSNAGGIIDDIKHFVTQNPHYNHGLTIGVGIWSYLFLNHLIKSKRFNLDSSAAMVLAFIGAYFTSKLAKDYPGYTTVGALVTAVLSYSGIINPRL
jgi:hypothetical protein